MNFIRGLLQIFLVIILSPILLLVLMIDLISDLGKENPDFETPITMKIVEFIFKL